MDSYQNQLNDFNAREEARKASEWREIKAKKQRYEDAAKEAHKIRWMARLVSISPVPRWDDLDLCSQRHLIADAEAVAKNPSITESELRKLYRERLIACGDTDHPDLDVKDNDSEQSEEMALQSLKSSLSAD